MHEQFHNTAQVTLDTFFGSSETKWGMQSALTLLLPHGFGMWSFALSLSRHAADLWTVL